MKLKIHFVQRVLAGVRERLPAGLMPDAIKRKVFPGETRLAMDCLFCRWYCAMQNISAYFKIPVKDRLEIISSLVSAIEKSLDTYDLGRKQLLPSELSRLLMKQKFAENNNFV